MYDAVRADDSVQTVVLTYKVMFHLTGTNRANYPNLPERDAELMELMQTNMVGLVNGLVDSGKSVVFVMQAPETPRRTQPTVYHFMDDDDSKINGVPRTWWQQRSKPALEMVERFDPVVKVVDPADVLCGSVTCFAGRDGVAWYRDDNHMTLPAANMVAKQILEAIDSPVG